MRVAPLESLPESGSSVLPERPNAPGRKPIPKHFPALDGLRGFAVLAVFFYHYGGGKHSRHAFVRGIGFLCSAGWTGVTLFFLLSGFLITGLLWDSKGERGWFRKFYIRRALRILPLYYGTLLVILLWPLFDHRCSFRSTATVVWIHALYLQNLPHYNWTFKQIPIPFWVEHYWTLAVEEQFYLVWPLLLFFLKTRRQAMGLCLFVCLGSVAFDYLNEMSSYPPALWHSLQSHAGELAFGGGLALAFRGEHWPEVKRAAQVLGVLGGVVFLVGMYRIGSPAELFFFDATWGLTSITLCFGGLLSSMIEPGLLERVGSAGWLRWVGKISFGLYIFHLLPVHGYDLLCGWLTGRTDGTAVFDVTRLVVAGALTVALAWMSFQYYERRFLRLKARFAPHGPVASRRRAGRY